MGQEEAEGAAVGWKKAWMEELLDFDGAAAIVFRAVSVSLRVLGCNARLVYY